MDLFKVFEKRGMDVLNSNHIYCLQYMFIGRIQQELNEFRLVFNMELCHYINLIIIFIIIYLGKIGTITKLGQLLIMHQIK